MTKIKTSTSIASSRECELGGKVTAYWTPTMSDRAQARLPPLTSHRRHAREPFHVAHKVRKHEVELHVLASVLAG